jgi:uncharacterized protein (TIGR02996 family)
MSDLAGLLDDIREHPDDDAPRLVCADWFEDHGQHDRAEFIRLQCDLERTRPYLRDPGREQEIDRLLRRHARDWAGSAHGLGKLTWRRGFIDSISCRASVFLANAEAVVAATTREVRLDRFKSRLADVVACRHLGRIRALTLVASSMPLNAMRALGDSRHLTNLRELTLRDCELTDEHLLQLSCTPLLPRLHTLDLTNNRLSFIGLEHLSRLDPACARVLRLRSNSIGEEGAAVLARLPGLANLRELDLAYCVLPAAAGVALAGSPHLRRLDVLDLHFSNLNWGGAEALAASPVLGTVRELEIGFNEITNQGARAVLHSPHLTNLVKLNISHSEGTPILARHLASSPVLPRLRWLALHYNGLRDDGIATLAKSPAIANLLHLDLRSCDITHAGIAALAASPHLTGLRSLNLGGNQVGVKGARALVASPHLTGLWRLACDVYDCSARGMARLEKHFGDALVPQ